MSEYYYAALLVITAASGYAIRWATSFSLAQWDEMVARFREVNDQCLNSLREAGEICRQREKQRDAYIADQRAELKRLNYELSDVSRERDDLREKIRGLHKQLDDLQEMQVVLEKLKAVGEHFLKEAAK